MAAALGAADFDDVRPEMSAAASVVAFSKEADDGGGFLGEREGLVVISVNPGGVNQTSRRFLKPETVIF